MPTSTRPIGATLAALALLGLATPAGADRPRGLPVPGAPPAVRMERHTSQDPPFVLYRPVGWKVRASTADQRLRILITEPDGGEVELSYQPAGQRRPDALQLLAATLDELRHQHPDLAVSGVSACRADASCAVASLAHGSAEGPVRQKLFLHAGPDLVVLRSYRAPAARFEALRPLLLDVLTNVHLQPGPPAAALPLVKRRAPDGSLSLGVPAQWQFQAGRGMAVASAPAGEAGFMFTSFQVFPAGLAVRPAPGTYASRYLPPPEFLTMVWESFRNRDVRILRVSPDVETAAGCPRNLQRACEAADVTLSWSSPQGRAAVGGVKVLTVRPGVTGQWFGIVAGIWCPAGELTRWLPTLDAVAASFAIDDWYARGYIEQGVRRLRALEAQTRGAMNGLYQAVAENQRDYERRAERREASEARQDDYRRGNSYWVSDLEGGKVYATDPWGTTDTTTGDRREGDGYGYIHFEGQNPIHRSEQMREVSSFELEQLRRR